MNFFHSSEPPLDRIYLLVAETMASGEPAPPPLLRLSDSRPKHRKEECCSGGLIRAYPLHLIFPWTAQLGTRCPVHAICISGPFTNTYFISKTRFQCRQTSETRPGCTRRSSRSLTRKRSGQLQRYAFHHCCHSLPEANSLSKPGTSPL